MIKDSELPFLKEQIPGEQIFISPEGLKRLLASLDPNDLQKNLNWTVSADIEMPIRVRKSGYGSLPPITVIEMFEELLKTSANFPAMSLKKKGKWVTTTYKQYYDTCKDFAKALISLKINKRKAVNIIGFNSPEWFISFVGSLFGFYLPVGVYTTNGPEACKYVADHSDCEIAIVEDQMQLEKYIEVWDQLPQLKYVVVYGEKPIDFSKVPEKRKQFILTWNQLLEVGKKYKPADQKDSIEFRMREVKPGNTY